MRTHFRESMESLACAEYERAEEFTAIDGYIKVKNSTSKRGKSKSDQKQPRTLRIQERTLKVRKQGKHAILHASMRRSKGGAFARDCIDAFVFHSRDPESREWNGYFFIPSSHLGKYLKASNDDRKEPPLSSITCYARDEGKAANHWTKDFFIKKCRVGLSSSELQKEKDKLGKLLDSCGR